MRKKTILTAIALALMALPSGADDETRSTATVTVGLSAFYMLAQDSQWSKGPSVITSLAHPPGEKSFFMPVPSIEAKYKSDSRVEYRGGILPSEHGKAGLIVKTPTGRPGTLEVFVSASLFRSVWKDPYIVNSPRSSTPAEEYGLRVGLERIMNSPVGLTYSVEYSTVSEDEIGRREPLLKRGGLSHKMSISWQQRLGGGFYVKPQATALRGDIEGAAESYKGEGAGLELGYMKAGMMIRATLSAERKRFDARHPVIGGMRSDRARKGMLFAVKKGILNKERLSVSVGFGADRTDSSLDFFDTRRKVAFAGMGWEF